ncbi:unnamed protein product [Orchesella dallaii]|uniref:Reverse transcriptase domain-containing protein n=1 Tax=Orchesella dallaii TaxID=48710 RepID=A0ABP1QW57_9HEXA
MVRAYAGSLSIFKNQWIAITSDPFVLSAVSGYEIEFTQRPLQFVEPKNPEFDHENLKIVNSLVEQLLEVGAISKVKPVDGQYISSIFPVPKQNGKHRLVLNLKPLNEYIKNEHFKMEDWRTVSTLLDRGMFMAKIDLKDAYHFIPIGEGSRKFIRFRWKEKIFEYQCMPFGLSSAPRIFTKVMKKVMKHLRHQGLLSVVYLDDILLFGYSYEKCLLNLEITHKTLLELGFRISEKSVFIPTVEIEYLGLLFNSEAYTISLPQRKKDKIRRMCDRLLKLDSVVIQELAELVGTLVSACPGIRHGPLYTRELENVKTNGLIISSNDYNATVCLTNLARDDILWWLEHLDHSNPIKTSKYDMTIETDASLLGWGACCGGRKARGLWSEYERNLHINVLEMLAVQNALEEFADELKNISILLRVDNKTAIAYINKFGGCRSDKLHSVAKNIWTWCEKRDIELSANYISSTDNFVADKLSREGDYNSEWELNSKYYDRICSKFGTPYIDLFATFRNTKCETYYSWLPDRGCVGVDAFTITWKGNLLYAFPPFALIPKVLRKIRDEKATVVVVVPNWSSQPWFPMYMSMKVSEILRMGPDKKLLTCPLSRQNHPMKSMQLLAAVLCGKHSELKD